MLAAWAPSCGFAATCASRIIRPCAQPSARARCWPSSCSIPRCSGLPATRGSRSCTAACATSTSRRAPPWCCAAVIRSTSCRRSPPRSAPTTCSPPPTSVPTDGRATSASGARSGVTSCASARRTPSPRAMSARAPTARTGCSHRSHGRGGLHGWDAPSTRRSRWRRGIGGEPIPDAPRAVTLPPGEHAALARLAQLHRVIDGYATRRGVPADDAGTSRLSVYLKYGCLHPRQVLDRVGSGRDADRLRSELAWRDFYAHVLAAWPHTAREPFRAELAALPTDDDDRLYERGRPGPRAIRPSMPACASCSGSRGCTTACACSSPRSS